MEAFLEEEKLFKKKGKPTSQMGGRCVVGAQSTNRLTKPESLKFLKPESLKVCVTLKV